MQSMLFKKHNNVRKSYGELPLKEISAEVFKPWERVDADLMGPLVVNMPNRKLVLNATPWWILQ